MPPPMLSRRLALSLLAGLAVPACGPGGPTSTYDESQSNIVGGVADTGDPAVVALFAHQPGAQNGSLCTCEVISPTVLLTAAHCVSPTEVGAGAIFEVITSPTLGGGGTPLAVASTHFDTAFDINNPQNGHDVGIVILQNPVSITPLPINRAPLTQASVGQSVRIIGYGLNDGTAQTGAGTKRQATTTIDAISPILVQIGNSAKQTCNGDSGGPALLTINGVETIIGTTSYGNQNCTQGSVDTRVDQYLAFIDTYAPPTATPPPMNPPPMNPPPMNPPPPTCTPMCSGKVCGVDGCGGTCGSCGPTEMCSAAGQCITSQPPPSNPPPQNPPPTNPPPTNPPPTNPPPTNPPPSNPPPSQNPPPAQNPPPENTPPTSPNPGATTDPAATQAPAMASNPAANTPNDGPNGIEGGTVHGGCNCVVAERTSGSALALLSLLALGGLFVRRS